MTSFEGFTREEVIKSGSSRIPCFEFLVEDFPCADCPCKKVCATGLSCSSFRQYLEPNKKKRMQWPDMMRIPTRNWFRHITT